MINVPDLWQTLDSVIGTQSISKIQKLLGCGEPYAPKKQKNKKFLVCDTPHHQKKKKKKKKKKKAYNEWIEGTLYYELPLKGHNCNIQILSKYKYKTT
jgi:hypothetical protein